ncbi:hypothetical protein [Bacillus sp. JCM 19034]|uniref:hypothetical protein n=1 Tax=Bacillus sp. JCM 19034 TaxID=1481928 RepID=UPI000AD5A3A9|nr:hypothetical protein [Bacillus sp. JCM 19034]
MRQEIVQFLEDTINVEDMKHCIYQLDAQGLHTLIEHLQYVSLEAKERWFAILKEII